MKDFIPRTGIKALTIDLRHFNLIFALLITGFQLFGLLIIILVYGLNLYQSITPETAKLDLFEFEIKVPLVTLSLDEQEEIENPADIAKEVIEESKTTIPAISTSLVVEMPEEVTVIMTVTQVFTSTITQTPTKTSTLTPSLTATRTPTKTIDFTATEQQLLKTQNVMTATASIRQTATSQMSQYNLCSPIANIFIHELPTIISQPFNVPNIYSDMGHHGVDLGSYNYKGQLLEGWPLQSVLPGEIVGKIYNRPPIGNAVIIETIYEDIPVRIRELLNIEQGKSLYHLYAHMMEPSDLEP
ncbi:MAG: hypothetical protein JEZ06_22140, partial [Anaerolineaceae bacterium]|nr:hypothetical protein [Anaerolineaceae bacterium]